MYKTESTCERNNIFVGKDIEDRKQTSRDSTKMYAPMQQQTRRMDGDGPAITSSEIETAYLSRLSFRRETLEVLLPSCDGFGHELLQNHPQPDERALPQQATIEEKVVKPQNTEKNGMSTMGQVTRDVAQDTTSKTRQACELSATHHIDRSPTDSLTDQSGST